MHLVISGRVQGVGFRFFALNEAHKLKLTGWVKNRADGAVEVCAEGEESALLSLLDRLKQGPPSAIVKNVAVDWRPASGHFNSFEIKH